MPGRRAPLGLVLGLFLCSCAPREPVAGGSAGIAEGARTAWNAAAAAVPDPVSHLRAQALALAERMAAGLPAEEWERARVELRNLAQAPAWSPQADSLPWADWIDQARRTHPDLAAQTLIGAHAALDGKALSLALDLDEHGSADGLRLAAHRVLWAVDPDLAAPRASALLFRETPRAGDRLRPAYVEEILPEAPRAAADELFLQVAAADGMEHRARLLAIRAALARRLPGAGPVLESVFLTERNNFALRREALQALLALEPARGKALLGRAFEEEGTDPGFKAWIAELRAREGVAAR